MERLRKNWFTEKLIDCFATGTIPIYWGCPNIEEFFNKDGIIQVNNIDELLETTTNLDIQDDIPKNILLENFLKSREYMCAEDQIFRKINKCG